MRRQGMAESYIHQDPTCEAYGGTDLDDDVKRLDLEESSYDSSYPGLSPAEQDLIDSVNSSQNMSASEEFTQLNSKIENEMTAYETKDLLVKVDKPEKVVRAMESFVQYTVSTKTTREDFDEADYCVKRRYNDFLWLRDQLTVSHPLLIVAPLPEKQNMTIDRFDKEFVRFREVALNRFINRLCEHPILSHEKCLHSFLTMEQATFTRTRKATTGLASRVSRSFHNLSAGSYRNHIKLSYDQEAMYKYVEKFSSKMSNMEQVTNKVIQQQNAYSQSIALCSKSYNQWAHNDPDLSPSLNSMCELFDELHVNYLLLIDDAVFKVALPFREYQLFTEVIKSSLDQRDMVQYNVENISSSLTKVQAEHESVEQSSTMFAVTLASGDRTSVGASVFGKSPETQLMAKKATLQGRIQKMTSDKDSAGDKLEVANAVFQADYQRWHVNKKHELKQCIGDMAARNISYYDTQITHLESLLRLMRERNSSAQS